MSQITGNLLDTEKELRHLGFKNSFPKVLLFHYPVGKNNALIITITPIKKTKHNNNIQRRLVYFF